MVQPQADPDSRADPRVGEVVAGRYRVLRRLGQGGMGEVYEVEHLQLGRSFALKCLKNGGVARDEEMLARFRREAELVGRLRHPNVVQVSDWDTMPDGTPCMIMELLTGATLGRRIRTAGPLTWPAIARFADQITSALAAAHRIGIVHRDLKAANIFVTRDHSPREYIKLLDFGVSKYVGHQSTHSAARLIGTPEYMSPEQASALPVGVETDVWAAGVVLYEMATGALPFTGEHVPAILYQICHVAPPPLRERRPDAPQAFVDIVEQVLCNDPARRITDARALQRALRRALCDVGSEASIETSGVAAALSDADGSPSDVAPTNARGTQVVPGQPEQPTVPPIAIGLASRPGSPDMQPTVVDRRREAPRHAPPAAAANRSRSRVAVIIAAVVCAAVIAAVAVTVRSGADDQPLPPPGAAPAPADPGPTAEAREGGQVSAPSGAASEVPASDATVESEVVRPERSPVGREPRARSRARSRRPPAASEAAPERREPLPFE